MPDSNAVGFVSYERWPRSTPVPADEGWPVVPDLAVEVVSPSNSAFEIKRKIREYFAAGVRLVWVVYPDETHVECYDSPTSVRILDRSQTIDGGDVLPGFQLALTDLFEDVTV
jgi:Uma2 family endonuclease